VGHISRFKSLNFQRFVTCGLVAVSLLSPAVVSADEQAKTSASAPQAATELSPGLQFNLPTNTANADTLGQSLNLPALNLGTGLGFSDDLPADILGSGVFNLDVLDTACITGQGSCITSGLRSDYGLTTLFSTNPEKKLGISLRPRAALRVTDDGSSALVGGVVEFSKKSKSGAGLDNNTWYFFAGADAETVNYSNVGVNEFTRDGFSLRDRVFVGDAKAGLGYRIGGADLSVSYLRRQASSDEFDYKEDAAALSFTWKR